MASKLFITILLLKFLSLHSTTASESNEIPTPCTCGIFLSGQFEKGSKEQPKGIPVLTQEIGGNFPNNPIGIKQCTNKCLDSVRQTLSEDLIFYVCLNLYF